MVKYFRWDQFLHNDGYKISGIYAFLINGDVDGNGNVNIIWRQSVSHVIGKTLSRKTSFDEIVWKHIS